MTYWRVFENWLVQHETEEFTCHDVAASIGCSVYEASGLINAYQSAQRGVRSKTRYVLKRRGRTRAAVWSVGQRTADARLIEDTTFQDIVVRVRRAMTTDLTRLAGLNPRAARKVELTLVAVDSALKVLAVSLDSDYYDDDGDSPEE